MTTENGQVRQLGLAGNTALPLLPLFSSLRPYPFVDDQTIILPRGATGDGPAAQYRLTMMVPRRRFLSYLKERWWVVVVFLAIATGAVLTYETIRSETYNSYAQLMVGDVQLNQLNMANLFTEDPLNYFGTQIELLKSSRLQGAAFSKIGITAATQEKDIVRLQVARPLGTATLQLQATGPDAAKTQGFLQALIEEYLSFKKETRTSSSEDLMVSLNEQLGKRQAALKLEQERWTTFQRTNNVAALEEEGKTAGLYLAELNLQLAKLRLERDLLRQGLGVLVHPLRTNAAVEVAASIAGVTNVEPSAQTASQPAMAFAVQPETDAMLKSARLDLALRQSERDQVLKDRGELAARRLNEEVSRLSTAVAILEEQNRSQRKSDLQDIEKRLGATESAVPAWETKVLEINARLSQAHALKNNIQNEQAYYDHLLGLLQNVDLSRNVQQERASILQAPTPGQPAKRVLPLRLALAVLLGLALGLGFTFVWHLFDDRLMSVRDLKAQFGEAVLGLIPEIKVPSAKPQNALVTTGQSHGGYFESFRHLRSALALLQQGTAGCRTLLITSSQASEGKTTIAINLARLLAWSGFRVVLVDADGTRGGIGQLLGAKSEPGVADFVRRGGEDFDIVRPTDVEGLSFVSGGTRADQSEGLFLRSTFGVLMERLRVDRDFVIIDAAPVLAADDSGLFVPHADSVVLITRPYFTRSRLVRQTLDMLYQRKAKHVSFVLNRARADDLLG